MTTISSIGNCVEMREEFTTGDYKEQQPQSQELEEQPQEPNCFVGGVNGNEEDDDDDDEEEESSADDDKLELKIPKTISTRPESFHSSADFVSDTEESNATAATSTATTHPSSAELWLRLKAEAEEALEDEPELSTLLSRTILSPGVNSFEDAVAMTVCYRLLQRPCLYNSQSQQAPVSDSPVFCPHSLNALLKTALTNTDPSLRELGHSMSDAVIQDALAVLDRDPACDTLLEVILFMKGFAALVCHRAARQKWIQYSQKQQQRLLQQRMSNASNGSAGIGVHPSSTSSTATIASASTTATKRSMTALFLQSQASAVFGVDIHPAAAIGAGILLDHGTGIVIGETARVGDGCTLLHGVTLGGTGKEHGDRHPKVGPHVLIGAGASILGNIQIGAAAKIGAGSIVLQSIPAGATAVGAPAKIIGRALEPNPASTMDENLHQVGLLHKSASIANYQSLTKGAHPGGGSTTVATESITSDTAESSVSAMTMPKTGAANDSNKLSNENASKAAPEKCTPAATSKKIDIIAATAAATFGADLDDDDDDDDDDDGEHHGHCNCPFRAYTRMAKLAPKGTVTIETLRELLMPHDCTQYEIGSTFFDMDSENIGYIRWSNRFEQDFVKAMARNTTSLSPRDVERIVQSFRDDPSKRPIKT